MLFYWCTELHVPRTKEKFDSASYSLEICVDDYNAMHVCTHRYTCVHIVGNRWYNISNMGHITLQTWNEKAKHSLVFCGIFFENVAVVRQNTIGIIVAVAGSYEETVRYVDSTVGMYSTRYAEYTIY